MSEALKIALLHMVVTYQDPSTNRRVLLSMIDDAARQGAQLILAPEMALSGYSFDSRKAIAPFMESLEGPTLEKVRRRARSHGVYICVGLALEDKFSGIFTNSAVAVAPSGKIVCRYDKINAESRWACPGNPKQDNTFETPWGRVGVLICSDIYYGLMSRVTALREADLVLLPANWPPMGIDPLELWQARAFENGFYLAACNRSGMDRTMDCRNASSGVVDPEGELLLDGRHATSRIFVVDLPLTQTSRLCDRRRRERLSHRRPEGYHDCYLNLRMIPDLTQFHNLPQPGILNLYCIVPAAKQSGAEALQSHLAASPIGKESLYLLPASAYSDNDLSRIIRIARDHHIGVATCVMNGTGRRQYIFQTAEKLHHWELPCWPYGSGAELPRIDCGPARVHLLPFAALAHPEQAVSAAKQGCDLILAMEETLSPQNRLIAGIRTIENLAVSVCAGNSAGIWVPPQGHQRWGEELALPGTLCHCAINTGAIRTKNFQDNIDFEVLLSFIN